jgi:YebC/PmpR family DNA-binding regulatory protein
MGAQWKLAGKVQNANKRGAVFGKLCKEIIVAAKIGDPSPDNNSRLRAAIESAKKASVPRDTIERAIKKGAGLLDGQVQYELITWEGFTPHKVPVIVECLTDNKNRTASDVRVLFRKGQLGSIGAVTWMFDRLGVVEASFADPAKDIEGAAIEAGAQNVEPLEAAEVTAGQTGARFFCDPQDLDGVTKSLTDAGWVVTQSELSYLAKTPVELAGEERTAVAEFLNSIDEHDDVHRIYTALK